MALFSEISALMLAAVFLYSGADKALHWRDGISEVTDLGLPFPALFAAATIASQLVGGLAVASGIFAGLGALLLGLFTVLATVFGHKFWLRHGKAAKQEFTTVLEHLAIVGGLLGVVIRHDLFR
jgi:uncharacterized membrane protein YphA (DoxX/SURF4 family)